MVPRADVGGGGLVGALTVLLMVAFRGEVFDFQAVESAVAVLLVFGVGYMAERYKSLAMAVAAPVASLATSAVGTFAFDQPFNKSLVSTALATVAVAVVGYLGRPESPDVLPRSYSK